MSWDLVVALVAFAALVAVAAGTATSIALERALPERRRLNELLEGAATGGAGVVRPTPLTRTPTVAALRAARFVPRSPTDMGRLRRRLGQAGYDGEYAPVVFAVTEMALPVVVGLAVLAWWGAGRGLLAAAVAALGAYLLPGVWLARRIGRRRTQIRNGLPDALDLLIVCIESGSSLDQAILKASEELALAHPALAEELRLIVTEVRAGKPRLAAFKDFADRTRVDDVRALVSMMVQTDRFGTSIAQALRTHAETARTKRRQAAEEKASKLGVKLVFPLVLCVFPAFYVVTLGPAIIQFLRVFVQGLAGQ